MHREGVGFCCVSKGCRKLFSAPCCCDSQRPSLDWHDVSSPHTIYSAARWECSQIRTLTVVGSNPATPPLDLLHGAVVSAARSVLSPSLDWHDVSSLPHDLLHGAVGVQPDPYSHSGRIESRHTPTRFTPRRGG